MKQLTILRHAKSSWDEPRLSDFDRPLNARGVRAAEAVGRELKRRGLRFDHVIASPAVRVRETLERLRTGFGGLPDVEFDQMIYGASVGTLLEAVSALPDASESALLVGHNPGLHQLVLKLTAKDSSHRQRITNKYPTGAAAVIGFSASSWSGIAAGELDELVLPREIGDA